MRVEALGGSRGTAAAASAVLTVMRTSSEPARRARATCATVAATSAVSVLVIDWTTIGAPPPTRTPATSTRRLARRAIGVRADRVHFSATRATPPRVYGGQIERLPAERHADIGRIAERQLERRRGGHRLRHARSAGHLQHDASFRILHFRPRRALEREHERRFGAIAATSADAGAAAAGAARRRRRPAARPSARSAPVRAAGAASATGLGRRGRGRAPAWRATASPPARWTSARSDHRRRPAGRNSAGRCRLPSRELVPGEPATIRRPAAAESSQRAAEASATRSTGISPIGRRDGVTAGRSSAGAASAPGSSASTASGSSWTKRA